MGASPATDWFLDLLDPKDEPGKRRSALLQATFDVIAAVGFEGLRTRAVAQRAGVNVATLHYYFPTKQDLIEGLAQFIGAKFVTTHGPAPAPSGYRALDRLRQEFSDGRYYQEHHPEMLLAMQEFIIRGKRDPKVQKVVDQMNYHWRRGVEEMVIEGLREGTFRADIDQSQMLATLMAIFSGTAVAGIDQIDAIARSTESWVLSTSVKKELEKRKGDTK